MISKCNVFLMISVLVLAGSTATSQGTDRGNTLLTDSVNRFVIEIDESGTIVWEMTGLNIPTDAERLSNGNTLIAEYGANRVIEVTRTYPPVIVWQKTGLNGPHNAERLSNGNTLITDSENGSVIEVDYDGTIVWSRGELSRPIDVERLSDGNTLIVENTGGKVTEVDPSGAIVWQMTGLSNPVAAERIGNGNTFIADGFRVIEVTRTDPPLIVWESSPWQTPTDIERLPNGNTLIGRPGTTGVHEYAPGDVGGSPIWSYTGGLSFLEDVERVGGTPLNIPPVADAGADQTVPMSNIVTLDGSGSTDGDGDSLTYSWSFTSVPAGSAATLDDLDPVQPTFIADVLGTYVVQLVVNDGTIDSVADSVTITAWDAQGTIGNTLLTDSVNRFVIEIDESGTIVWEMTGLNIPTDAERLSNGNTLIAEYGANRVIEVTRTYPPVIVWQKTGLNGPHNAERLSNGNTLITDSENGSVIEVDPSGNTVLIKGGLSRPIDVERLSDGNTLIVENTGGKVTEVDPSGAIVWQMTGLSNPVAAERIGNGNTFIADGFRVIEVTRTDPPLIVWESSRWQTPTDIERLPNGNTLIGRPGTTGVHEYAPGDVGGSPIWSYTGGLSFLEDVERVGGTPLNIPPVADAGADQTVPMSNIVTLDGSGSTDGDGDSLTYSWSFTSVPAGSGATLSDLTAVNPTFTVDVFGTYVVQLIVNDGTVDSSPDTVTISTLNSQPVADAGPDQSVYIVDTVQLDGTASDDDDNNPLTFSWSLTVKPEGSGAMLSDPTTVNPTFTVDVFGTYVAQLIVNDGTVDSFPDTVTISTLNSPPVADAGPDQTAFAIEEVILDGSGSYDVDVDEFTYSWSVTSQPEGSSVTLSGPTDVKPTVTVNMPGTYVLQLIVHDGSVGGDPDTVTITVVNRPPELASIGDKEVNEGQSLTFSVSATDPDGCALTYSASNLPSGAVFNGGTFSWTPSYTQSGTYANVHFEVSDGELTDSEDITITVINVNRPPVIGVINAPLEPVQVDTEVAINATFSDLDVGDTHTATWSWDDGTAPSVGTVNEVAGTVTGNHTYTTAGVYTITLTVTDEANASDQAIFEYIVVYDPEGGFVTGGGWIYSPAGAFMWDEDAQGKANFGFVSKYKKGASVPTGNTEFQFKAGNLNFHSSSYDWLVVTGSDYARFKGIGTINGLGAYKFMLWAGDDNPDTFRIKIWLEEGETENVVYDNGMDQPIGGGSIKIHTK